MKLPAINYQTPTQTLGREDVGAPARAANAKWNIAKAVGQLANTAAEMSQNYALQDSILNTESQMADFESANAGKHFYSAEEIEAIGDEELTGIIAGRNNIPASEVYPQLYEKAYDKSIERNKGVLVGAWGRQYDKRMELDKFNQVANRKAQAMSNMAKEQDARTQVALEEDIANKRWESVHKRIDMFRNVSDSKRASLHSEYNNQERVDVVSEIIRTGNVPEAYAERNRLISEKDNRFENESTQLRQKQRLDAFLNGVDNAREGQNKAYLKDLAFRASRAVKSNDAGNFSDEIEMSDLYEEVAAYKDELPTGTFEKLDTSINGRIKNQSIRKLPAAEQQALMVRMENTSGTVEEELANQTAIKNINANLSYIKEDSIAYYNSNFPPVKPVIFQGDLEAFGSALAERKQIAGEIAETTGGEKRWMTNEEASAFGSYMNEETDINKLSEMSHLMYAIYGQNSSNFWDEIRAKGGMEGRYAVAGATVTRSPKTNGRPDYTSSNIIIQGAEIRKSDPKFKDKDFYNLHKDELLRALGGAYNHNTRYKSAVLDASFDAYAYLTKDTPDLEILDTEKMAQAIKIATGGMVYQSVDVDWSPFNDEQLLEAPYDEKRNKVINNAEFNFWTENIAPAEFAKHGKAVGYSNKQLSEMMNNGEIILKNSGENSFYLYTNKGAIRDGSGTGGMYELKYDDDYIMNAIEPGILNRMFGQ